MPLMSLRLMNEIYYHFSFHKKTNIIELIIVTIITIVGLYLFKKRMAIKEGYWVDSSEGDKINDGVYTVVDSNDIVNNSINSIFKSDNENQPRNRDPNKKFWVDAAGDAVMGTVIGKLTESNESNEQKNRRIDNSVNITNSPISKFVKMQANTIGPEIIKDIKDETFYNTIIEVTNPSNKRNNFYKNNRGEMVKTPVKSKEKFPRTDPSNITTDPCNVSSLTQSDYSDDICLKYSGDSVELNKKCNALSLSNCSIPNCCILVNGVKCVAGNINGPMYLTENGMDIDNQYYFHQNKCYGNCENNENSETYLKECGKYSNNSIGVSKACMVSMFNNNGCANPRPSLINDSFATTYSKTPKVEINNQLSKLTYMLKKFSKMHGSEMSKELCNGKQVNK